MNDYKIEIMNLYEKYKKTPKGPYTEKEFLARQIMQKIMDLNLLMHVSINQIHDMRYRYYLFKNLYVNNVIKETNFVESTPAAEPEPEYNPSSADPATNSGPQLLQTPQSQPPSSLQNPIPTLTKQCLKPIQAEGNTYEGLEQVKEISVVNQLTNLKKVMLLMTKLYNPKDEKTFIYAFHAFIIKCHAFVKISEIKNSFDWNDDENKINDEIEKMYKKFNSIVTGKNYPFWYGKDEINESVNANPVVGMNEAEAYNPTVPLLPKTPAPVNYCPNPRTAILKAMNIKAGEEVFTVPKELLDIVIEVDGKSVKATDLIYLNADAKWKCDPLSLRYFSVFKKHEFQEANMPPSPTPANIGSYVSALSYYMKLGKNYSVNNFDESIITKKEMIKACSDRIMETISVVTDAILKENKENTGQIYNLFKNAALQSEFKDEMLDMLEKQLRKDGAIMLNFDEK